MVWTKEEDATLIQFRVWDTDFKWSQFLVDFRSKFGDAHTGAAIEKRCLKLCGYRADMLAGLPVTMKELLVIHKSSTLWEWKDIGTVFNTNSQTAKDAYKIYWKKRGITELEDENRRIEWNTDDLSSLSKSIQRRRDYSWAAAARDFGHPESICAAAYYIHNFKLERKHGDLKDPLFPPGYPLEDFKSFIELHELSLDLSTTSVVGDVDRGGQPEENPRTQEHRAQPPPPNHDVQDTKESRRGKDSSAIKSKLSTAHSKLRTLKSKLRIAESRMLNVADSRPDAMESRLDIADARSNAPKSKLRTSDLDFEHRQKTIGHSRNAKKKLSHAQRDATKATTSQDSVRSDTPRKTATTQDSVRSDTPRRRATTQDSVRSDTPRKRATTQDNVCSDTPRKRATTQDSVRSDTPKKRATTQDSVRSDTPRKRATTQDSVRSDTLGKRATTRDDIRSDTSGRIATPKNRAQTGSNVPQTQTDVPRRKPMDRTSTASTGPLLTRAPESRQSSNSRPGSNTAPSGKKRQREGEDKDETIKNKKAKK